LGRSVAVVIVTFNAEHVLPALLKSIRASEHTPSTVIVVDNGSTDRTTSLLADADVELLRQDNSGFANGVNRGISFAPPDSDVLVLNPDVRLRADMIGQLAQVLEEEPGTAIVVPSLLSPDGTVSASLRRDPTIASTLVEAVVGGSRSGRLGEAYRGDASRRQEVDWATGAVMLLRRTAVDRVGLMDEEFFLYSEETEYCQRMRDHGYQVRYQPTAVATHEGGDLPSDPRLWSLRAVNRVRLYRRRHGRLKGAAFRSAAAIFEARRALMGDPVSRAALRALVSPSLERTAAELTSELGGDPSLPDDAGAGGSGWICFSAQDWWYHNQGHSDFQLMRGIALAEPVLVVNSLGMRMPLPGRTTSAGRRLLRKLRSVVRSVRRPDPSLPRFHVMTPVFLPAYGNRFVRRLNGRLVQLQVSAAARAIGIRHPAVLVTLPTAWDAAKRMKRRSLIVNRSDRYSALPEADASVIRPLEELLLQDADAVVYTSHELMGEERGLVGPRAHFLGHGVDLEHFRKVAPHPDLSDLPRPRVGFFGGIDDYTVDLRLLTDVADLLPAVQFVLVGDATCDISDLVRRPNVRWFGKRPYAEIPAFGSGFDVALMPWLDNDWIRHSNPIKLNEYLALGLPIVSTPYPELAHIDPGLVSVAADSAAFAAAIEAELADVSGAGARRAAVEGQTWMNKAELLRALDREVDRCAG
jgi:GT2 family glycosyltransferase/glycosyltransferase involved in cell wall biosynthesis